MVFLIGPTLFSVSYLTSISPVAPGATGEMLVKFNGSGKNQVSKTVTITANTQQGKETIKIKAFVNPKEGTGGAPVQTK